MLLSQFIILVDILEFLLILEGGVYVVDASYRHYFEEV